MTKLVLGKGLGALIPTTADEEVAAAGNFKTLPLEQVSANPMQPRHEFDGEKLAELAESIRQNGMLQPLVVKKHENAYLLVAGERRYRAARLAGLAEVPVVVIDAADNTRMLELALIENIQREDLNPIELASAYNRLMNDCGLTQQELSGRVGKSRSSIANAVRLLALPATVQDMVRRGELTEGHARQLVSFVGTGQGDILEMARQFVEGAVSVRQAETGSSRTKRRRLVPKRLPEIAEIESYLKQVLGTSVKVIPGLKRSRIEIEYYGDDDLGRLLELFQRLSNER